jgi:hypothetical protein
MLKLTYTENGFHLEHLSNILEDWVTTRVLLSLRSGTRLSIEPSTAAFLLPLDVPYLNELETLIESENPDLIELFQCDGDAIEVALEGTWITDSEENNQGIFVCNLSEHSESFLYQIWQESYFGVYKNIA